VAARVPRGSLVLLDLQREMLGKARRRIQRAGASNVGYVQGSATELPFADASFDVVVLVAVLGEVSDAAACVASIQRVLRPGGLLSVTEVPGDPDALPAEEVQALVGTRGYVAAGVTTDRAGTTTRFRPA